MDDKIRNRFLELKVKGQRCAISQEEKTERDKDLILFLKSVLYEGQVTDFEDVGFCYWNLSDNYAMLRNGDLEYINHRSFWNHLTNADDLYLYWLVCDATQKLTLEISGYADFWWELYTNAVNKNKDNKRFLFVEFHVHRAALCYPPQMRGNNSNLSLVKNNFCSFLEKTKGTSSHIFFETVFLSMMYNGSVSKKKLLRNIDYLMDGLSVVEESQMYLCGEWNSFITPFHKRKQAVVGIVSCVNAFIDNGNLKTAKAVYDKACELGLPKNHYIENRLR